MREPEQSPLSVGGAAFRRFRGSDRVAVVWAGIILLVSVAGLLVVHTYPFTDLPNHIAEAVILKYAAHSSSPLADYFSLRVGPAQPTIAHMILAACFPNPEMGMRLLYMIYVIAVPLLMAVLARRCDGDHVLAILSVLTLWNYNCLWGFTGFTLAIPMLVVYLLAHVRFAENRLWRNGLLLAGALCLVYWFQVLAFALAAACYVLFEGWLLMKSRPRRLSLGPLLPLLPGLLLLAWWRFAGEEFGGEHLGDFLRQYYVTQFPQSFAARWLRLLVNDGRGLAAGTLGACVASAGAFLLIGLPLAGLWLARHRHTPLTPARVATLSITFASLAFYFFLPGHLPGENYIYQRFSALFLLGLAGVATWATPPEVGRFARKLALSAASVYALLWFQFFWGFRAEDREFCTFMPRTPEMAQATIGALVDDADYRGHPALIHYNNYQIIWNHAPAPTRLVGYRFGAIRRGAIHLPKYMEWVERAPSEQLMEVVDRFAGLDYLMTHGDRPRALLGDNPDYALVKESAHWALYRHCARR